LNVSTAARNVFHVIAHSLLHDIFGLVTKVFQSFAFAFAYELLYLTSDKHFGILFDVNTTVFGEEGAPFRYVEVLILSNLLPQVLDIFCKVLNVELLQPSVGHNFEVIQCSIVRRKILRLFFDLEDGVTRPSGEAFTKLHALLMKH